MARLIYSQMFHDIYSVYTLERGTIKLFLSTYLFCLHFMVISCNALLSNVRNFRRRPVLTMSSYRSVSYFSIYTYIISITRVSILHVEFKDHMILGLEEENKN